MSLSARTSALLRRRKGLFIASRTHTPRSTFIPPFHVRPFSLSTPAHDSASSTATSVAPLQIGDLAAMGIASNSPVGLMQQFIELFHVSTSLPLWATIPASLLALKVVMLPVTLPLLRNQSRFEKVSFETHAAQARLDKAKQVKHYGDMNAATRDLQQLLMVNKINVFKLPLGIILEGVFPIINILAVRRLMSHHLPQCADQNLLWISDLSAADPYHILPAALGVSMLITNQVVRKTNPRPRPVTTAQKFQHYGPDVLPFVIAIASWNWSVGVILAASSSVGIIALQNRLLRNPLIRQKLKLAPRAQVPVHMLPKEKQTPLKAVQSYFGQLREDLFTIEQHKSAQASVAKMMTKDGKQRW